ncbi:MAG: aminoacetone oxidase family FAD-binding enzyme [Firmicutes bacterium]|nr:aminoacetone oxidase family FAD-binding enzyme [Bacillota bacterium]
MAAVCAARAGAADVLVLEKCDEPGRKLAATGNGKCNLSNLKCADWQKALEVFSDLGLMTRTDSEGRIYPYSEDARDVVSLLVRAAEKAGAEIRTGAVAAGIERAGEGFRIPVKRTDSIRTKAGKRRAYKLVEEAWNAAETEYIEAEKVLIATGGKSYPVYGTTGDGYVFARKLGHTVARLRPSLTTVETAENVKALGLSGVRAKGEASLYRNGTMIASERGEIQFTDRGISGICVFDLTREMALESGRDFSDFRISIDLVPDMSPERLEVYLADGRAEGYTERESLCSLIKAPVADVIAGRKLSDRSSAEQIKSFELTPVGLGGWERAQVTVGGVDLGEIDPKTMESLLIPGLYFSGEVTDYDGPCGGFNLQNAWMTGIKAGRAIAE